MPFTLYSLGAFINTALEAGYLMGVFEAASEFQDMDYHILSLMCPYFPFEFPGTIYIIIFPLCVSPAVLI